MKTKREQTIDAVWYGIDPSIEGHARRAAEKAKAIILALPFGWFADETEKK